MTACLARAHARSQLTDRSMSRDANVAHRHCKIASDLFARTARVEREDDDRALARRQLLDAAAKPFDVQPDRRLEPELGLDPELLQQAVAASIESARIAHDHATGAEHERCESLGLSQPAGAQALDHEHQDVLDEVVCLGAVPKVAKAVDADPAGEATTQLALGDAVGGSRTDPSGELAI
jgi:hypothetical protein